MKRVLNVLVDILIVLVFLVSLTVVTISLTSRATGVPNILGYTLLSIQTDSMEPTIMTGDLIISRVTRPDASYAVGDVVTFKTVEDSQLITITHRIVNNEEKNGTTVYSTKGDNAPGWDSREISSGDIIAQWGGTRLRGMGNVMDFLTTQKGFFFCVLLPMIFFFLFMLYDFIKNVIEYNKEKTVAAAREAAAAAATELTEEQKRKAIEEYLAQQKQNEQQPETQT